MKKKVFIGSSKEASKIVDEIERLLNESHEVVRWDISFALNKSALDNLIINAAKTDVAIFIGTADDVVIPQNAKRRDKEGQKFKNRDNVVFEFGLFLGMLGRTDCVYMTDQESDVMSDMDGITRIIFDKHNYKKDLPRAVELILKHFNNLTNKEINLFPSTSLASSYFVNFIKPLWNHYLNNGNALQIQSKKYFNKCELVVVIPDQITGDINAKEQLLFASTGIQNYEINCIGRPRHIKGAYFDQDQTFKIYNVPTILSSLEHSIKNILPEGDHDYSRIIEREKCRFAESLLEYAKKEHHIFKVSIISESQFIEERKSIPTPKSFTPKISFWGNNHHY